MTHCETFAQRSWPIRLWFAFSVWLLGIGLRLLYRIRVEGLEYLPRQGGVVIASNHVSIFDTLLIPYTILIAQGCHIVWAPAKEELFRFPVLRHILASWGAFPVRRGKGDLRAMRQIIRHMSTEKVMLFPEGTRSPDGRLQVGKRMVGKLMYQARPVIIPTAIQGTDALLAPGRLWPRWRPPVSIRYGPPVDVQRYYASPDSKATSEAIVQATMAAIAALLPPTSPTSVSSSYESSQ